MKRFKHLFSALSVVILTSFTTVGAAVPTPVSGAAASVEEGNATAVPNASKGASAPDGWLDSLDIGLLTCGPGQEVYSYYGHTALRINDRAHGQDIVVNYGIFSFRQNHFILRFVFGLTDYSMGIVSTSDFIAEYASEGRWVVEQRLHLSPTEKLRIVNAINENYLPENRTYRYNYFYDNCTTRARDMVLTHLDSGILLGVADTHASAGTRHMEEPPAGAIYPSWRQLIHAHNGNHRWARFGNDLLLGFKADSPTTYGEQEFLPDNLRRDFDAVRRTMPGYAVVGLVDTTVWLIPAQQIAVESGSETFADRITPLDAFLALAAIVALLTVWERKKKLNFWWLDLQLMLVSGLAGIVLLAMVFSQHPTVRLNLQILLLNPLNTIYLYPVIKQLRKGHIHRYWYVWMGMVVAGILGYMLQEYAEGIIVLAFILLGRGIVQCTHRQQIELTDR